MSTLQPQILFMMSLRGGQGEKGLVKRVTVQEILADIGAILNKIYIVLNDHITLFAFKICNKVKTSERKFYLIYLNNFYF